MKSKVVITGASGLLGSHFLVEFSQQYDEVVALYRSESAIDLVKKLFEYYNQSTFFDKVRWVKGDLADVELLVSITKNADLVIHSAALVSFEKEDAKALYQINVEGTRNILTAVSNNQVPKLAFISSVASIRDKNEQGYFVENGTCDGAREWTDYARSKTEAENLVLAARKKGLRTVIINPGVILGPGNISASSTVIFKTVKEGLKFYTDGINGVVDVRDVVDAVQQLLSLKDTKERYVCVGKNVAFKYLFEVIAKAFSIKPPSIKASPFLLSLACKAEAIIARLANRKPRITRENTTAAFSKMQYDSSLLIEDTLIEFRTVEDAVENAVGFFQKLKSQPRNTN